MTFLKQMIAHSQFSFTDFRFDLDLEGHPRQSATQKFSGVYRACAKMLFAVLDTAIQCPGPRPSTLDPIVRRPAMRPATCDPLRYARSSISWERSHAGTGTRQAPGSSWPASGRHVVETYAPTRRRGARMRT